MLPQARKLQLKIRHYLLLLFLYSYSFPLWAQSAGTKYNVTVTLQDMIINFSKSVPNLMRLVTAIAYVLGMYFIVSGIMKLKQLGESRTMMSQEHSIKGPMIFLVVGAALLYIPTSIEMGTSTFWTDPNPYGYLQASGQWGDFLKNIYLVVQLVGVIAFIRGLVILSHLGASHGQPGTFGKGLTHIIGGILCINIYTFVRVIFATLGITTSTS